MLVQICVPYTVGPTFVHINMKKYIILLRLFSGAMPTHDGGKTLSKHLYSLLANYLLCVIIPQSDGVWKE